MQPLQRNSMKVFSNWLVIVLSLSAGLTNAAVGNNPVQVRRINYRGWGNAVEMTNDSVRVVVVPAIGRIMHYGVLHSENILWENPEFFGAVLPTNGVLEKDGKMIWANFGGDRVWPIPENLFETVTGRRAPPDHWIDGGGCQSEILSDGVMLVSPVSRYVGVRCVREIRLSPKGSRLMIRQRMQKLQVGGKKELEPIPCTIWNIVQIRPPLEVLFQLNVVSRFPQKYSVFPWCPEASKNVAVHSNVGVFVADSVKQQKVGADSPHWIAALVDKYVIAELFNADLTKEYPEAGATATSYTCPQFTELEVLSPVERLKVNDQTEYDIVWELYPLPSTAVTILEKRQEALRWLQGLSF
jgi:hypothetical protein